MYLRLAEENQELAAKNADSSSQAVESGVNQDIDSQCSIRTADTFLTSFQTNVLGYEELIECASQDQELAKILFESIELWASESLDVIKYLRRLPMEWVTKDEEKLFRNNKNSNGNIRRIDKTEPLLAALLTKTRSLKELAYGNSCSPLFKGLLLILQTLADASGLSNRDVLLQALANRTRKYFSEQPLF